jgi:hypothetical protein
VVTGAVAERFIERGQEEEAEAIEAQAFDDLGAQVDRLALRLRELAGDLEALRVAINPTRIADRGEEGRRRPDNPRD